MPMFRCFLYIFWSSLQFLKHSSPISITVSGIQISGNEIQSRNACILIDTNR